MRKRCFIIMLFAFNMIVGHSQTEESQYSGGKVNWAVGGFLTLLAPEPDYYDKSLERYNPPVPMAWFGSSCPNGSIMGDRQAQFNLRSGVFTKIDCGFTILQFSRNLYRGFIGVSAGFQIGGTMYRLPSGYGAKKDGYRVEIAPLDDSHNKESLDFAAVRIPLLIGAQTRNRLFSFQTGLGLYHTSRFGAQWLVTAGLGPLTINYSQNLTPLFKLSSGAKAYPSSLSLGFDIWYLLCRFTHPK